MEKLHQHYPADVLAEALEVSESGFAAPEIALPGTKTRAKIPAIKLLFPI